MIAGAYRGEARGELSICQFGKGRAAFDELREGIKDIEFLSDPEAGEVRIGCQEAIAVILPPAIESFCRQHPGVVLDIFDEEFDRYAGKLRERSIDFILQRLRGQPRAGDPFFDDLDIEVLFDDELVVVAGIDSPWARRRKVDLADIVNEPWILATPESRNHAVLAEAFQMQGLPMPKARLRTFSTHLRCNLVASGHFIATFPRSVTRYYARRFSLHVLPVQLATRPWPVAILTLKGRTLSPLVRKFIEHLRSTVAPMFV